MYVYPVFWTMDHMYKPFPVLGGKFMAQVRSRRIGPGPADKGDGWATKATALHGGSGVWGNQPFIWDLLWGYHEINPGKNMVGIV